MLGQLGAELAVKSKLSGKLRHFPYSLQCVLESRLCTSRGQGNQAGVVSSLKGGTGVGMNRPGASDPMLQATSSPRNRRHNISGTDLVKKPVVSTAYTSFIGKQRSCMSRMVQTQCCGWGTVFHLVPDTARGQGCQRRLKGQAHRAPSTEAFQARLPSLRCHPPPLSLLVPCGQPTQIYCSVLCLARVAAVTTAMHQPTHGSVSLGEPYIPLPGPKPTLPTLKPPSVILL